MPRYTRRVFHVAAAILVLAIGLPSPAWAWGKQGHRIVGQIAEARLTPVARAAVEDLLGDGKHLSDDDVANWADQIRNAFPETGPWHFVDIPLDGKYEPARDCKYSDCVIDRIERFREVLANKEAKKIERQRALKFLVHFVGDLHQPLHCAERTDSNGVRDQGGNLCKVRFLDVPASTNLHKVWDFHIIEHTLGTTDPLDYAAKLNEQITADEAEQSRGGTVLQWALAANKLAVNTVYAGVATDGEPTHLDKDYVEKGRKVIDDQLAKAGIRLAEILNEALK